MTRRTVDTSGWDEEAILDCIVNGASLAEIGRELGGDRSDVSRWLAADEKRSARAAVARTTSAAAFDDECARLIAGASDIFELAKAKEMAQHLRWRASKIAPRIYGDKLIHEGEVTLSLAQQLRELSAAPVPAHAALPGGTTLALPRPGEDLS